MFHRIHHIAIICTDYQKAMEFYVDLLGFRIIRETTREEDVKIDLSPESMDPIGYEIELFIKKDAPERLSYPEACGLRHLAFHVDSVLETVEKLTEKGIPCEPFRMDRVTGRLMTFFRDPDGLPLEIHE